MDIPEQPNELQICPTRADGAPVLFAHKVSAGQCQDRQRGLYHKCFTCVFNNAFVSRNGRTPSIAPAVKLREPRKLQVG